MKAWTTATYSSTSQYSPTLRVMFIAAILMYLIPHSKSTSKLRFFVMCQNYTGGQGGYDGGPVIERAHMLAG